MVLNDGVHVVASELLESVLDTGSKELMGCDAVDCPTPELSGDAIGSVGGVFSGVSGCIVVS